EKTASNIDLMQNLTAQVVQELHGKFAPSLGARAVQLKPASTSEDYYFVTGVFREELMKLGIRVIEPVRPLSAPLTPAPATAPVNPAGAAQPANGTAQSTLPSTAWSGTYTQAAAPPDTSHAAGAPRTVGAGAADATAGKYVLEYQNVVFNV